MGHVSCYSNIRNTMYFVKKKGEIPMKNFIVFIISYFFQNLPLTAEVLNNLYHDTAWAASIKQHQITNIKQTVTNAEENFLLICLTKNSWKLSMLVRSHLMTNKECLSRVETRGE